MWWSFYFFTFLNILKSLKKAWMISIFKKKIILDFSINNKTNRKTSFQDTGKELRSSETPWKMTADKGADVWLGPQPQHYWHFNPPHWVLYLWHPDLYPLHALCLAFCPRYNHQKCLQTFAQCPQGAKWPWVRALTLSPGILHVKDESFLQSSSQAQGVGSPSPCLSLLKCFLLSSIPPQTRRQKAWTEVSSLNTT